jgi:adenosylcobyric acid synthase
LGLDVAGYEIHHGRTTRAADVTSWLVLDGTSEGATDGRRVWGTSLHGLFESDAFRAAFLGLPAATWSFEETRQRQIDGIADVVEQHLDLSAIEKLIRSGDQPGIASISLPVSTRPPMADS